MARSAQSYQGDKVPDFRIATKAMEMLDYTLRITENKDIYPNWTRGNLVRYIRDSAADILRHIVTANDISRGGTTPYEVRLEAQEQAIRDCSYLLSLIDISERTGRISASRAQYWGKKVRDVKYMCMAWRKGSNPFSSVQPDIAVNVWTRWPASASAVVYVNSNGNVNTNSPSNNNYARPDLWRTRDCGLTA